MRKGKVFLCFLILITINTFIFSQIIISPAAIWDPAGIKVSHGVIVEGTIIKVSATIKILKNIRGIKYRGGVDMNVLAKQPFPGQLNSGITIPVKFEWKAVRGRHNLFFRLIIPVKNGRTLVKRLDKTINVVPRIQDPGLNVSLPNTNSIDLCSKNQNTEAKLKLKSFTAQYFHSSKTLVFSYKVLNNSSRCAKELYVSLKCIRPNGQIGIIGNETVRSVKPGGWALKGYERRSFDGAFDYGNRIIFMLYPQGWCYPCDSNPENKCIKLKLEVKAKNIPGNRAEREIKLDLGPIQEE